ncbi:hypothetical protein F1539_06775 [Haemophilus influenzae biotype aegyptius]|nr:hypothetical protein F1541_05890 [Haemophilus influenzae biotype aegyptius]QEQ62083.1 hypothetical protein F1539_06775 [Haemophilus influenzae biotype aegyptius]QEQ64206.1 hypothetical protein F1538_08295 [Haemophilus influenzae biotype aegyptius]QEQ65644.1 hypothetical protein F1537_06150 [Haemophilus influenzae biotype aegyptius]
MSEASSANFREANFYFFRKQGKAGLLFFLLTFSLAKQRKSKSPSGEPLTFNTKSAVNFYRTLKSSIIISNQLKSH